MLINDPARAVERPSAAALGAHKGVRCTGSPIISSSSSTAVLLAGDDAGRDGRGTGFALSTDAETVPLQVVGGIVDTDGIGRGDGGAWTLSSGLEAALSLLGRLPQSNQRTHWHQRAQFANSGSTIWIS